MKEYIFLLLIYIHFFTFIPKIKSSEIDEVGKHILINFRKEIKNKVRSLSPNKYMEELIYKQFYSKFQIGIPNQRIQFYYEINSFESTMSEDYYEKIRSTTYKNLDTINNNTISQEILELNPDNKIENFTFILKPKGKDESNIEKKENPNILGLGMYDGDNKIKNNKYTLSFMEQLKKYNYIEKKIFTPLIGDYYINENRVYDGQILIGVLPHEVNPVFEEKDLKWISIKDNTISNGNWHIYFDNVKYNNEIIKDKIVDLDLSLNIVIGPENFRQKLLSNFFKKHIKEKKCMEDMFYNSKDDEPYIFYSCSNEAEFIDIPKLSFYSKALNETFELSFDKLFSSYRHRFYFNIVFRKKPQNKWIFGQIFFNNYRFVFDAENGRIGYYKTKIQSDHPFLAIFIIVFALSIFFIIYLNANKFNYGEDIIYDNKQLKSQYQKIRKEYEYDNNKKDGNKDEKIDKNKNKKNKKKNKYD